MKRSFVCVVVLSLFQNMSGQVKSNYLPYSELEEAYEVYTPGTIVARMIDGLGFRYYWSTDQIRKSDLRYKPSDEARTFEQTIDHVLDLSRIVLNCALQMPNDGSLEASVLTYDEKRRETLYNLKQASEIFKKTTNLEQYIIVFKSEKGERSFPFWNNINGPIEDAVWHCGQLVSMRRASGNPLRKGVNFFTGKVK